MSLLGLRRVGLIPVSVQLVVLSVGVRPVSLEDMRAWTVSVRSVGERVMLDVVRIVWTQLSVRYVGH